VAPLRPGDLRVGDAAIATALARAAPGQTTCSATGAEQPDRRTAPVDWIDMAQRAGWQVLLDAAAFAPTNPLDLARYHPDYVTISWYKVFGLPDRHRLPCWPARTPWPPCAGRGSPVAPSWRSARRGLAPTGRGTGRVRGRYVNFLLIPDVATGLHWIDRIGWTPSTPGSPA